MTQFRVGDRVHVTPEFVGLLKLADPSSDWLTPDTQLKISGFDTNARARVFTTGPLNLPYVAYVPPSHLIHDRTPHLDFASLSKIKREIVGRAYTYGRTGGMTYPKQRAGLERDGWLRSGELTYDGRVAYELWKESLRTDGE